MLDSAFRFGGGRGRVTALWAAALCALALMLAPPAAAEFGFSAFDGAVVDENGESYRQAGGHPYAATTTFELNLTTNGDGTVVADGGGLKDVSVDLPPGLVGNPTAVPECPRTLRVPSSIEVTLANPDVNSFCPASSIVGIAAVKVGALGGPVGRYVGPIFNIEPPWGVAAQLGFSFLGQRAYVDATLRPDGTYGLRANVRNASQAASVLGTAVTLWGVPADPVHDSQRCIAFIGTFPATGPLPLCNPNDPRSFLRPHAAGVQPRSFLTNPSACTPPGVGLETRIRAESWNPASAPATASFISHLSPGFPEPPESWGPPAGVEGCDALAFDPSIDVKLDSRQPDSPTGMEVRLTMPQDNIASPVGTVTTNLKRVKVTLPEGMTVSPSSAHGLQGCSDAQLSITTDAPVQCPEASKVGTVEARTPLLDEDLRGAVYIGTQNSDDPESGELFRVFLALDNPARGILVKLRGHVRANPQTGRLEATFDDNPQVPVSEISVRFRGGDRAPLATPPGCGTHTLRAELSSWAGQTASLSDAFTLDCPGVSGFAPRFSAGTVNAVGGAFSPLVVNIDRYDRQQYVAGLSLGTPTGLLAKLKGVQLCPDAQAASGTCPIESRIGTATVGAGPGANPFYVRGSVSLTGPYRGAPYGLVTAARAAAGPFDLGMVVVRQAIFVDPTDAHLTVVSDPLPTIVKGVPLRLRSVSVDVDRPGFAFNPTSCAEKRFDAAIVSASMRVARVAQRFQVGNCRRLGFSPKLTFQLTGKREVAAGRHPALRTVFTQPAQQANSRSVRVTLPLSLALDPENAESDTLCEFLEGQKANPQCPKSSIVGEAVAMTPVLNRPLRGPVYFVKNVRISETGRQIRTLPTLLVALRGEVAFNLRARTNVSGGKLVTNFPLVPDAPVTRFELRLKGGFRGILTVSEGNLCSRKQVAQVEFAGHNGKRLTRSPLMKTPCSRKHP